MRIFEQFIAMVAPHYCIECEQEGQLLCTICVQEILAETSSYCALCTQPTLHSKVCTECRQTSVMQHIWVLGEYEGVLARLIHVFKFERARAAAETIALAMNETLPSLPSSIIIVPLPTAPCRVRQRGYDQSVLIAKALARYRKLEACPLLLRNHNGRQLGADKARRFQQAARAYRLAKQAERRVGRPVLLVDDVLTTGASLSAAAALLAAAGYDPIMAVVAAKRPFKK